MKNNILVTGGLGALGYNLILNLLQNSDNEISVIDNLSSGNYNKLEGVNFIYLDISNAEKINLFFENYYPDYIFHLAAHFANQNSVDHPRSDVMTNIIGTINLFESQKNNKQLKKIIFASSSCVYGNKVEMIEDINISPYDTPYAINKYVGELYCKYYSEIHKIPNVILRIFNSFGPGELYGKYRNVIPNFIFKALKNEDLHITGTGLETRDFTYIDNTVNLLIKLSESKYYESEVFNSGTGKSISVLLLAETIIKLTKSKSKIIFVPQRSWDHVHNRKSNIYKSENLLNYFPKINLEKDLEKTIEWLKSKI